MVSLFADQRGRGVRDRQPASEPVVLEVRVDQDMLAVLVGLQTVPGKLLHFVRPAAGVDEDLDRDSGVPAPGGNVDATVAAAGLRRVEPLAQLGQDLAGQRPEADPLKWTP
ncbi:hypothetical protein [Streptomyces cyaneofuscatus]|uniref:hypothetical protein n=1 Tax=Streptomyces cyaneofuscatus TaxID=66883 RepID=UPI00366A40A7